MTDKKILNAHKNVKNFDYARNIFRFSCYEILKAGFSYPDLKNYGLIKNNRLLNIDDDKMGGVFCFIKDIPPIDALQVVYSSYFDAGADKKGCFLREGSNLGEKAGLVDLLMELKGFYKNFGLELPPNELPDFIGIEFEFMCYLNYLLLNGGKEEKFGDESKLRVNSSLIKAQIDFIERHISRFLSDMAKCMKRLPELKFYCELSEFGSGFIADDLKYLKSHLRK